MEKETVRHTDRLRGKIQVNHESLPAVKVETIRHERTCREGLMKNMHNAIRKRGTLLTLEGKTVVVTALQKISPNIALQQNSLAKLSISFTIGAPVPPPNS